MPLHKTLLHSYGKEIPDLVYFPVAWHCHEALIGVFGFMVAPQNTRHAVKPFKHNENQAQIPVSGGGGQGGTYI